MDPRKLLYFASVVEEGSFKKAARTLSISQPALSTSMDRFELSIGERVLDRGPTGVVPTALGEVLYAHARLIREELERAQRRLVGEHHDGNMVTIGTLPSLAASILPRAVATWRERHGTTLLRVAEKNQLELLLALVRGEVDFIVAQTECFGFLEGMRQRVLFRDRLRILARPGHPAFEIETPTWAALSAFPWVIQMVGRQRMLLQELLSSDGASMPAQLTECGSVAFIKSLVAESDSLSLLPQSAIGPDIKDGRIQGVVIDESRLDRDIAVLFREGSTPTDAARDLIADIASAGLRLVAEE